MEFLDEFKRQFPPTLSSKWPLDRRIKLLEMTEDDVTRAKNLPFERISENVLYYRNFRFEIADLSQIVGVCRAGPETDWLACLDGLHKKNNFERFVGRVNYQDFLLSFREGCDELPRLIERGGKYYVSENGMHRVTIAKCLSISQIPASVAMRWQRADSAE